MSGASHLIKAVPGIRKLAIGALVSACLCVITSTGWASPAAWQRQRTPSLAWLHAVFFLDQNRGWVVGSKGSLLQTLDGGNTWTTRPAGTEDVVRDIFFVDDQNGWMVCEVNAYQLKTVEDPRAYLMKTTDGGEHWKRIEIKGFDVDAILVRAVFNRNGHGWTFGEGGSIFKTYDAGDTWERLRSPTRRLLLG